MVERVERDRASSLGDAGSTKSRLGYVHPHEDVRDHQKIAAPSLWKNRKGKTKVNRAIRFSPLTMLTDPDVHYVDTAELLLPVLYCNVMNGYEAMCNMCDVGWWW